MTGIAWMPVDPVPTTPTRRPRRSTPSCGHRPVWNQRPVNESSPGMSGTFAVDRQPTAVIRNRQRYSPPVLETVQVRVSSSNRAPSTRTPNRMSSRRPNLSVTCSRYALISGWRG
jgi:hypothetical protein